MQDIWDAILKKSAGKDGSAEYWSQEEQSKHLHLVYEKWDATGKVWSASTAKVGADLDVTLLRVTQSILIMFMLINLSM